MYTTNFRTKKRSIGYSIGDYGQTFVTPTLRFLQIRVLKSYRVSEIIVLKII